MINSLIEKYGIMPIVNTSDFRKAQDLAKAMCKAGMKVCEVVFRSEGAVAVLTEMKSACPDMLIGAGTIISEAQAETAIKAGAQYLISPGFDKELVEYCIGREVQPIPGTSSASEVQMAVRLGLTAVKFFPAEQLGGLKTINALAAPFPTVKYIPTNGVGFNNIREYISNPHILACGGTFPCPPELIDAGSWDDISALCQKALQIVEQARA